jgi:putative lipoic acid-binding regulatory protein
VARVGSLLMSEVEIKYPIRWSYRIILLKENVKLLDYIITNYTKTKYQLKFSKSSKSNKYETFILQLVVKSNEQRVALFESLRNNSNIVMVL